ncbi:ABC transporter substrate-binding protein [Arthrobacter cupressi]
MSSRKILSSAAVMAAAALALSACAGPNTKADAAKPAVDLSNLATTTPRGTEAVDRVAWNLPYEPLSLDPMIGYNYAENTVTANLCESLMRLTPELKIEPGLAESVSSPDATTLVYKIRAGVTFWDGTPLTADDVAFSLSRQTGDAVAYFSDYFRNVKSVTATGEREVTVKLGKPDVLFEQGMAMAAGAIVQKKAAEASGKAFGTPEGKLQCTGPFALAKWTPGKSIELNKNPEYWDSKLVPLVKNLSFSFIADESTAVNALRSGDIDGQYFYLPPAGISQLEQSDKVTLTHGKSLVFWTLAATSESGPFANPKVREALSLAIDRNALAKVVFQDAAIPAPTLVGPDYWGYEKDAFAKAHSEFSAAPNIEKAKQLLAEAGPQDGSIVLGVQGSSAVHEQTANLFQAAGTALGLKVETKVIPVEQFGNLYFDPSARKGIDGFFTTYYGNFADPLDVYQIFRAGGNSNYINWNDASEVLDKAVSAKDGKERAQLLIEAQKLVTQANPRIPLAYEPNTVVQNKRISGATASFSYLYYPWAATIGGVK